MKTAENCVKMLFFSLLTAVFFYPFLHEFGHLIFALLAGVKTVKFNLLPLPYFACKTAEISGLKQVFIGAGGQCFSYLFSMLLRPRKFWAWYVIFVLRLISLYALMLSMVGILFYICGITFENDDVVRIITIYPRLFSVCFFVLALMLIYGFFAIKKEKPFFRLFSHLEAG